MAEQLRAARPADRGHRFAHAAQRRARLRGLRRRQHRHGQCLRHWRGAPDDAGRAARRVRRHAARRRDGQGSGAAPAGRCRRSAPAPASARCSSSAARSSMQLSTDERATLDQHDGRTRRLHRPRRARRRNGALPARAPRHRVQARAVDEERCRRALRRGDPHRLQRDDADGRPPRATPATACRWPRWPSGRALDIAYGGSCTAGKREDFDHYHAVLAWAAARGLRVADGVKLYLQFGTVAVRDYCTAPRLPRSLRAPSAPNCCNRRAAPAPTAARARRPSAAQVTVSAINRNFPGRSGPGQVWLASPPTVAASAIAGRPVLVRRTASARRLTLPSTWR